VIRLTDAEARLLAVPPDQPAILFQRVTRDPGGAVVEYCRSLYRGDPDEVHTRHRRPGVAAPEPHRREVPKLSRGAATSDVDPARGRSCRG
jgi:hypothetical protein